MPTVFEKLNLKDQREIVVLDAPPSFAAETSTLRGVVVLSKIPARPVGFALAFVTRLADVEARAAQIAARAEGDAVVWFAYPKGSLKRYKCEFNRDTGWAALGGHGFEPVRQVAIDEDWSALRFRRATFIKTLKRDPKAALSPEGARKAAVTRAAKTSKPKA